MSETLVPEGGVISELCCGSSNMSGVINAKKPCAVTEILEEFADEAETRFEIHNGAYALVEDDAKAILNGAAD